VDGGDDDRRRRRLIKHLSPSNVADVSTTTTATTTASQARAARAMAEAMADDSDHMADAGGADEHAACDALTLALLRTAVRGDVVDDDNREGDEEQEWEWERVQAQGALAMLATLADDTAEGDVAGYSW
jgi:hypothetical protein